MPPACWPDGQAAIGGIPGAHGRPQGSDPQPLGWRWKARAAVSTRTLQPGRILPNAEGEAGVPAPLLAREGSKRTGAEGTAACCRGNNRELASGSCKASGPANAENA